MSLVEFYLQVLDTFEKNKVEYLVVGGHAVNFHGYVRATLDMDLWVNNTDNNLDNLFKALIHLGFNEDTCKDAVQFFKDNHIISIPNDKLKINLLDSFIIKENFIDSYKNHETLTINQIQIKVVGLEDLMNIKYKSNRTKDMLDLKELKILKYIRNQEKPNSDFKIPSSDKINDDHKNTDKGLSM